MESGCGESDIAVGITGSGGVPRGRGMLMGVAGAL